MSFKQPEGQVAQYLERLQEYDFTIEHRPGMSHANADALSSRPRGKHGCCPSCGDTKHVSTAVLQPQKANFLGLQSKLPRPSDPIIARFEEGKPKPSHNELSRLSPISRAIWAQRKLLELKDNVLRIQPREKSKNIKRRVILPEFLVRPALQRLHDGLEGSHFRQLSSKHYIKYKPDSGGLALSKLLKTIVLPV